MTKLMIAALAATTALATPAFANTDTTTVSATIAPVCAIDGPADISSVALTGSTGLGNVTVTCNDAHGFTATVSSANAGLLKDSSNNSPTTFAYSLSAAGMSVPLTAAYHFNGSDAGIAAGVIGGVAVPVSLSITGHSGALFAGTYSDVITWDITAN